MKKRLLLTSAVLGAAVLSGIFLATGASASTGGLKSRLAEKLGIEESRVKGAMDEIKSEIKIRCRQSRKKTCRRLWMTELSLRSKKMR